MLLSTALVTLPGGTMVNVSAPLRRSTITGNGHLRRKHMRLRDLATIATDPRTGALSAEAKRLTVRPSWA